MPQHTDHIQFAGDYKLDAIVLHNHQNEGIDPDDQGIDITPLVIEMNIYEGIEKTSITGSLVIRTQTTLLLNYLYRVQREYHLNYQHLAHMKKHM